MHNLVSVAVLDGADDLLKETARLFFWHPAAVDDVLE